MSAANIFNISQFFWSGSNGDINTNAGSLVVAGLAGNVTIPSGLILHRTQVTTTPYTGKSTDLIVGCLFATGTSGVIVLPSGLTNTLIIKDESGTAGISNIIVSGSPNIENGPNYLINASGGSISVYNTPNGWRIF